MPKKTLRRSGSALIWDQRRLTACKRGVCKCHTDYGDGATGLCHVQIRDDLTGVNALILLLDVCHYEVWIREGVPETRFITAHSETV